MFGFHERFYDEDMDDEEVNECTFSERVRDSLERAEECMEQNMDKICAGIVGIATTLTLGSGVEISEYPQVEEDPISFTQEVGENFGDNICAAYETIGNYDDMVEDLSDDQDDSPGDDVLYSDEPY